MSVLIIATILSLWSADLTSGQSCPSSSDSETGQCRRDLIRNITLIDSPLGESGIPPEGNIHRCVNGSARAGDLCDNHCSCPAGDSVQITGTGAPSGLERICLDKSDVYYACVNRNTGSTRVQCSANYTEHHELIIDNYYVIQ